MEKRTNLDFIEHELHITKTDNALIHFLKKPNTITDSIKYINAGGVLAVTGDYGNWIFCREFHPGGDEVSDGYWIEKLRIASTQKGVEYDSEKTLKAIEEHIKYLKDEYGEVKTEYLEYYNECKDKCECTGQEYQYWAYENLPSDLDYESILYEESTIYWLNVVFDGFDEICRRLKLEVK